MARVLVALGGNAIRQPKERGTAAEQATNVRRTCQRLADIVAAGHELVITHGNGPQVGSIVLQNELARETVPPLPLDVCGAESQGQIGYLIQQSLGNELAQRHLARSVVSLITQTLVDENDPAFQKPSKPIGPFVSEAEARRRMSERGEAWVEDAGRGWRRVVPSPRPLAIVEAAVIASLREAGAIVIAAGGGGVPVVRRADGTLVGVAAVVDKDLAAARLADQLGMEVLLILTDVAGVALDYGRPEQRFLGEASAAQLEDLLRREAFPPGSMGPKVAGAVQFIRSGGLRAVICSLEDAVAGLEGHAGTQIVYRRSRARVGHAA